MAEGVLPPDHRLGIERFTHAGQEAQRAEVVLPSELGSGLHQHPDGRGGRVPDRHALLFQDVVPARRVELGLVDDAGHAVGQRRHDAVRRSRHPSRIRRAPEDVAGVQIERQPARHMMGHHGLMHVRGALRLARGAAGEVEQRDVLGIGRLDRERVVGAAHERRVVVGVRHARRLPIVADQEHVLEIGQRAPQRGNLAAVERLRGHQHAGLPRRHPHPDGLRPERREERTEHAAVLERPQGGHVQLGDPAGKEVDALTPAHAECPKDVGEAARELLKTCVRVVLDAAPLAEPAKGQAVAVSGRDVTIHRLVRDVESEAAGQPVELSSRRVPRELCTRPCVVTQIGRHAARRRRFPDRLPGHTEPFPRSIRLALAERSGADSSPTRPPRSP